MPMHIAACPDSMIKEQLLIASQSWLTTGQVCDILIKYDEYKLPFSGTPPSDPPSAQMTCCPWSVHLSQGYLPHLQPQCITGCT